jgi:hypothetical protein
MNGLKEICIENSCLGMKEKISVSLENNLIISYKNSKGVIQELRAEVGCKNLRFIGKNDSWIIEYNWIGYNVLDKFLLTVPHHVRAYKLWAELYTGQPLYSWTNKPIWWFVDVKPSEIILNMVPELVEQTVLLENSKIYFGAEGYSGNDHFVNGVVAEFKRNFINNLNMRFLGLSKKRNYIDVRKEIFQQFSNEYDNVLFRNLLTRKQRPSLYILKYPREKFHASWIRKYNETNRNHAWRGDKGAREVKEFFSSFQYSKILEIEPLNYIISTSLISYDELVNKIDRNEIRTLEEILFTFQKPRDSSRLFLNEFIGTMDVKLPLLVETGSKKIYIKESFPRGQIAVIQSLFQKNRIIKKLNKHYKINIPLNGVYKFKGQSRGRAATNTTVFEDISATTDKSGFPISDSVNIFVKNSTEFVKQRLIEDRLFKILSFPPREESYNIIVDITHPEDLECEKLPKLVKKTLDITNSSIPSGWIDIGIPIGSEKVMYLASVYGAIKYSRCKNQNNDHVGTAERILLSHHITKASKDLFIEMDKLFEKYEILNFTPRDLSTEKFLSFTLDFIRNFLSTKSCEKSPST